MNEELETKINEVFDKHILEEISGEFICNKTGCDKESVWMPLIRVYISRQDVSMKFFLHEDDGSEVLLDTPEVMKADQENTPLYHPITGKEIKDFGKKVYFCFVKYPILHLNLIKVWFDMIKKGDKKEEYRDITEYWGRRFVNGKIKIKGVCYHPSDVIVCFSNGYAKNRDQIYVQLKGMKVGKGRPEWGAQLNQQYYVLQLKR